MDHEELQSHHHEDSSTPLISRVDRLDSLMRYIEGKEGNGGRLRSINQNIINNKMGDDGTKKLEVAFDEAHSTGSLMDRILSLEDRLIRLCLEIESNKTSPTSSVQPISTYPVFNNPQLHINGHDQFQKKCNTTKQNIMKDNEGPMKHQVRGNKVNEKAYKSGKRRNIGWPHLKILGC